MLMMVVKPNKGVFAITWSPIIYSSAVHNLKADGKVGRVLQTQD